MSVNELLKTVRQLSVEEFQLFYAKIQAIRSQKTPIDISEQEKKVLTKVNAPFSRKKQIRFHYLIAKRDLHTLTEEEYRELLSLTQAFEKYELRRLKLLTKLADIKKITLPEVIDYYNICLLYTSPSPRDRG